MRNAILILLLVTFCSCHRSDIPRDSQNKTLKVRVYETSPSDGRVISAGGASVPARKIELGDISSVVASPGSGGHLVEEWCSITQVSSSGVQVEVHLSYADDYSTAKPIRKPFEQKILVPYDRPVNVNLLQNILFEAHFELNQ